LVLAAGASLPVTLTLNPNKAAIGRWGGLLTATSSSGVTLRTALGFINESEHYDVTVNVLDRAGRPTTAADVVLTNPETGEFLSNWDLADPTKSVYRVAPGAWSIAAMTYDDTTSPLQFSMAIQPEVIITKAAKITLDLRQARPAGLTVTEPGLTSVMSNLGFLRSGSAGDFNIGLAGMGDVAYFVTPTKPVTVGSLTFAETNTQRIPELTAQVEPSAGTTLSPQLMWADTRLDGTHTYRVVDAGNPASKISGAIALLGVDATGPIDDAVTKLAQAGAVAVFVYATTPDAGPSVSALPAVPTVWLPDTEGQAIKALLGSGPVRMKLTGQYYPTRVFDTAKEWPGRVPAQTTLKFSRDDLARIDESYRTMGQPGVASEYEFPESKVGGWAVSIPVQTGGHRSLYVSPDLAWSQFFDYGQRLVPEIGAFMPWVEWEQPFTKYQKGKTAPLTWLTQVARPAQPTSDTYGITSRAGDDVFAYLSPWTDGNGRVSWLWQRDDSAWTLSSAGKQIAAGTDPYVTATLPAQRRNYSLVLTDSVPNDPTWQRSTSTKTTWTFSSAHVDPALPQPLALLSVDEALPLDATNSAPAGKSMTFQVTGRLPAGLAAVPVRSLNVETSANGGKTWKSAAKVTRVDQNTFTVTVANPNTAGAVALRITAKADDSSIQQEVMAAYNVR
jgi:hypothetical protein